MSDVPVYFSVGDENEYWSGITRARALEWTRVFLHRRPSVPGTVIWMVEPNLEKGIPAGFTDWARRAEVAEAIGFTPHSYEALHASLDEIDPTSVAAHPDNHLVTTGLAPVRPFEAERWATWNSLVKGGMTAREATLQLLSASMPAPLVIPSVELGRTIELADFSFVSPVVLYAPHAGTRVPDSCVSAFTISREELVLEHTRMADHATDRMARLGGVVSRIAAGLSRLVVDVERFEGDAEEMHAVGMGALYTHGSQRQPIRTLDDTEREPLLRHFRAYGDLFAELVEKVVAHHGRAVILDLHSFPTEPLPYELHAADRRPDLCIGVDARHTPAALVDAVRTAFAGWDVAINEPFRGSYVPLRQLGDARVSSVMLDIRRDRYLDADGVPDDGAVRDIARRIRALAAAVSRP